MGKKIVIVCCLFVMIVLPVFSWKKVSDYNYSYLIYNFSDGRIVFKSDHVDGLVCADIENSSSGSKSTSLSFYDFASGAALVVGAVAALKGNYDLYEGASIVSDNYKSLGKTESNSSKATNTSTKDIKITLKGDKKKIGTIKTTQTIVENEDSTNTFIRLGYDDSYKLYCAFMNNKSVKLGDFGFIDCTDFPTDYCFLNGCNFEEVVKYPTCTDSGFKRRVCKRCGYVGFTEGLPVKGHVFSSVVVVEPTCQRQGKKKNTCDVCGFVDTLSIPIGEHLFKSVIEVEPTCQKQGKKKDVCSVCGFTEYSAVEHIEHNFEVIKKVEPSCTRDGKIQYKCAFCGERKQSTVEKIDHQYDIVRVVESTCQKTGKKNLKCKLCGKQVEEKLEKIAHQFEVTKLMEPTCMKSGMKISKCKLCGKQIEEKLEKINHQYEMVQVIEPTCEKPGIKIFKCKMCEKELQENFSEKLGHSVKNNICVRCGKDF